MTDRRKQIQRRLSSKHTVQHSGGGHLKIKDAAGATIATLSSTPDSERSVTNEEALLRRLGVIEAAHKTVTLDEETVDLILGAPSRNRQSLASWCHDAIVVGQQLGLRTPAAKQKGATISPAKAASSLTTQVQRLRRERTNARFRPWVAALLIAASEPPGAPQEPPGPQPAPEAPAPAAAEEAAGTNRAKLARLEGLVDSWEGRLAAAEAKLQGIEEQLDEIRDVVTRPNELRGQLAGLLRALMEPA